MDCTKEYIRDIQLAGLKMLHEFDNVCKEHGVSYFAISGTLLGAIRHKGYIPWDDDLDLGILREEYEKLEKIPPEAWGNEIELVTAENDDVKHDKLFPRIYLKNSRIQSYEDVREWKDPNTGEAWSTSLMIDLFVFDEIPDNENEYQKVRKNVQRLRNRYKSVKLKANINGSFDKQKAKRYVKYLYGTLMRKLYGHPWKRLYNRHMDIISNAPRGNRIGCYYSTLGHVCVIKKDIFPLQFTDFEDMMLPIPNNYRELLELNYGDTYMQFPPENERYHINFIFADLGNGRILNIDSVPGSLGEKYQEDK